jgi:hypothetical protein
MAHPFVTTFVGIATYHFAIALLLTITIRRGVVVGVCYFMIRDRRLDSVDTILVAMANDRPVALAVGFGAGSLWSE